MNATKNGRRRHRATVRKFVFVVKPPPGDVHPLAVPANVSAWAMCAEDALRSVAADVPVGWSIVPAGSE